VPGVSVEPPSGPAPTNSRVLFHGSSTLLNATHLHVAVSGTAVLGSLVPLSPDTATTASSPWVAFVPDAPFPAGATVTATITSAGIAGITTSFSFTIGSAADDATPAPGGITSFSYSTGSTPEDRNFELDIDPATDDSGFVYYHLVLSTPTYQADTIFDASAPEQFIVDDGSSCTPVVPKNGETMHVVLTAFDLAGNEADALELDEWFADPANAKRPGFACAVGGTGGTEGAALGLVGLGCAMALVAARRRRAG
ncbi:MAG TPA: hypothetical protein VMV18_13550, partial [bacterium]|nr:hypothetical protein [bacterium]